MGCCGSTSKFPNVDDNGNPAQPLPSQSGKAPASARKSAARATSRRKQLSARLSRKQSRQLEEENSRSVVGRMVQEHETGRRYSDEYDESSSHVLGSGMSGSVSTALSKRTGVKYAIKMLNIEAMGVDGMKELRKEIDAMRRLDHPNIVRIFETYEDEAEGRIVMVLELCSGGELVNKLMLQPQNQGLSEQEAAKLVTKMLSALRHCHMNDVVHRDIKLDNFVYENEEADAELKLIDFGLSHVAQPGRVKDEMMKGRVGTLSYMAPEVLNRRPYTAACDMWSLGVVAFILLSGRRPFHSRDRHEKIERILHTEPNFASSSWKGVPPQAVDFVQRLLIKDPEHRMRAEEAMAHPWIVESKAAATDKGLANPAAAIAHNVHVLRSMQVRCPAPSSPVAVPLFCVSLALSDRRRVPAPRFTSRRSAARR